MANTERAEIQWASFGPGVRINASAMETPAVAKDGKVRIYRDCIHGDTCLVVEDPSLPLPVVVPWHSVATVVYVPVLADAPDLAAKKPPVAKAKSAEPVA